MMEFLEWNGEFSMSTVAYRYTLLTPLQMSVEKKVDSAACWEITFVTITIAQSPTGDVIDIFVRNASRGRKSLKHDVHVYYSGMISPREFKIIKGIFLELCT